MRLLCSLSLIWIFVFLVGCDQPNAQSSHQQRQARPHLVEIYTVNLENVQLDRLRTGTVRATTRFQLFVQEEGQLAEFPWHPGDRVTQGDPLMTLDDRLLRSQIARSRAELNRAERDLDRVRTLSQRNLTSIEELQRRETELDIARAELAMLITRLSFTNTKAPFSGVITERLTEPGTFVSKNMHLLTLIDPQSLVIDVHLSEQVITHLSLGDAVDIQFDALGTPVFSGEVTRVYPEIDPLTRRGQVEIRLDLIPPGALPGQLARVSFSANLQQRMMIPFAALRFEQGEYVYLMNSDQRVEKRAVISGVRVADRIEVLGGLEPEDQIIIRGFMGLTAGREVTPVTPLAERVN